MINIKLIKWFKKKLVRIKTLDELREKVVHYAILDIPVMKKIYNLYKNTGLMDLDEIYPIYLEENDVYFIGCDNDSLDVSSMFESIIILTYSIELDMASEKDLIQFCLMFNSKTGFLVPLRLQKDEEATKPYMVVEDFEKEYYYLLSLNPYEEDIDHIHNVEIDLKRDILNSGKIMDFLHNFKDLLSNDNKFKNIITLANRNFSVLVFESEQDREHYLISRDRQFGDRVIFDTPRNGLKS